MPEGKARVAGEAQFMPDKCASQSDAQRRQRAAQPLIQSFLNDLPATLVALPIDTWKRIS